MNRHTFETVTSLLRSEIVRLSSLNAESLVSSGDVFLTLEEYRSAIKDIEHEYNTSKVNIKAIRDLYENKGKIDAVKAYRDSSKLPLKDSKDAVESLASNNGWQLKS